MDTTKMSANRPSLLRRVFLYIRRHGITHLPARIWKSIKTRPSFNAGVLLSYPISSDMILPPKPESIQVEKLSADDLEALRMMASYEQQDKNDVPTTYQLRIPGGEICYIVRVDGKLATYVWVAVRERISTSLGGQFLLKPDELYLYEALTLPEYRGRGYYPFLKAYACREMAAEYNRRAALSLVRWNNKSSLRASEKLGNVKRLGTIGVVRIFGYRFNFYWPPAMRHRRRG